MNGATLAMGILVTVLGIANFGINYTRDGNCAGCPSPEIELVLAILIAAAGLALVALSFLTSPHRLRSVDGETTKQAQF